MRANKSLLHGDITASIIDSFFDVHKELGFGFREYIYSRALQRLLVAKEHKVEREVPVLVYFRGEPLAYERMDMLVDDTVVIENKAREPLDSNAQGQLFAALAATNLEVGLLLHFWEESAVLPRLLRKSVQAPKQAVSVAAVAVPF
jgi:GxxExxY protein